MSARYNLVRLGTFFETTRTSPVLLTKRFFFLQVVSDVDGFAVFEKPQTYSTLPALKSAECSVIPTDEYDFLEAWDALSESVVLLMCKLKSLKIFDLYFQVPEF